jgi:hypothetical protein
MDQQWSHVLSSAELDTHYALTASLDPSFAQKQRQFYESRSKAELSALMHQAWLCNEPTSYQLARSHAAHKES